VVSDVVFQQKNEFHYLTPKFWNPVGGRVVARSKSREGERRTEKRETEKEGRG